MTREAWLLKAVELVRPDFERAGSPVPDVRVSVGWPRGSRKIIGQCAPAEMVDDKKPAIFISPVLVEPAKVLKTLIHECVHATGIGGHRAGDFGKLAGQLGLVAPWKSSTLGEDGLVRVNALAEELGPYDHAGINVAARGTVQTTRMLKAECQDDGYTVRLTRKWIESMGPPTCPCGEPLTVAA